MGGVKTSIGFISLLLAGLLWFAACTQSGMPLAHSADCKFKTPDALAQSIALCLKQEDFTCANAYLPGLSSVFGVQSTNPNDSAAANFGEKAEHLLVTAFKKEIVRLREGVAQQGGDIAVLKLLKVTQSEKEGITHMVMELQAGSLAFTLKPVGLFNNEGSWYLLGARFTASWD